MNTLKGFSEKERAYDAYQARQNYLRMQRSIEQRQQALEQALAEERTAREAQQQALAEERAAREAQQQTLNKERQEKEAALQAHEAALAELAQLRARLANEPSEQPEQRPKDTSKDTPKDRE